MFTDKLEEELGKKTLASGQLSWGGEERGSARETTSRNTYGLPMLRTFNFDSNGLDDMLEEVEAKKEPFEKLLLPTLKRMYKYMYIVYTFCVFSSFLPSLKQVWMVKKDDCGSERCTNFKTKTKFNWLMPWNKKSRKLEEEGNLGSIVTSDMGET